MDVKQAVNIAADYVAEMEQLTRSKDSRTENDGLQFLGELHFSIEGTRFDENKDNWIIEVGFTRPWDKARSNPLLGIGDTSLNQDRRTIKTIVISDANGKVVSYGD